MVEELCPKPNNTYLKVVKNACTVHYYNEHDNNNIVNHDDTRRNAKLAVVYQYNTLMVSCLQWEKKNLKFEYKCNITVRRSLRLFLFS